MIALPGFLLNISFHLLTVARPISCSSLNIELLIACLCNYHDHLTSIKLSSEDLTGRKTNFILGQSFANTSFTFFDLCIDRLLSTTKIFWIFLSYLLSTLFFRNQQTVFLPCFYNNIHMYLIICVVICSKHI